MSKPSERPAIHRTLAGLASGETIRLVAENGQWTILSQRPEGTSRLGTLAASAVETLVREGKLKRQADGSLLPSLPAQGHSAAPLVNTAESPLAWLRTRRDKAGRPLISDQQFLAGERLRADFERAMLSQRVTSNWDPAAAARRSGGSSPPDMSDSALAARQRFHRAMDAAGPELSSILYHVCCLASGIEQAERMLDLPQRSGKAVLGLALSALVRHYGIGSDSRGRRRDVGHWAVEDYRPAIPALEDA